MIAVHIHAEQETDRGWRYAVTLDRGNGQRTDHDVTLSWADHEHWCGGQLPPSRVIEAVLRLLAGREGRDGVPATLPARFDAATARRWWPALDRELARAL